MNEDRGFIDIPKVMSLPHRLPRILTAFCPGNFTQPVSLPSEKVMEPSSGLLCTSSASSCCANLILSLEHLRSIIFEVDFDDLLIFGQIIAHRVFVDIDIYAPHVSLISVVTGPTFI